MESTVDIQPRNVGLGIGDGYIPGDALSRETYADFVRQVEEAATHYRQPESIIYTSPAMEEAFNRAIQNQYLDLMIQEDRPIVEGPGLRAQIEANQAFYAPIGTENRSEESLREIINGFNRQGIQLQNSSEEPRSLVDQLRPYTDFWYREMAEERNPYQQVIPNNMIEREFIYSSQGSFNAIFERDTRESIIERTHRELAAKILRDMPYDELKKIFKATITDVEDVSTFYNRPENRMTVRLKVKSRRTSNRRER